MPIKCFVFCFAIVALLSSCGSGEHANPSQGSTNDTGTIAVLRRNISMYPDSPALRLKLTDALIKQHAFTSALAQLDTLLAQDSTIALLHFRRAKIMLEKGDTNAGLAGMRKALALAPGTADIMLEIGYVQADRRNKEALVIADSIIAVAKDADIRSQARMLKGIYFANSGDKQAALREYDASIVDNYTFLDAFMEKAIVLYELKRYAEAQATLDKAQAIRPADAEVYLWKGKCFQAEGKKAEAMDNYRKCLGLNDGMKEASDRLAVLGAGK